MRKLGATVFTFMMTCAFLVLGNPAAHAFGSEVLGCAFDAGPWTASSCAGGEWEGDRDVIHFSPQNLSGTYSKQWTVTNNSGNVITANCSSTLTGNCIYSGCTSSSLTCAIGVIVGPITRTYTASLRLTQSGLTRTIQAQGITYAGDPTCLPYC